MFLGLSTIPSDKDKGWSLFLGWEILGKMRQSRNWPNFLRSGHVIKDIRKLVSAGLIYEDWFISTQRRDKEILDDEGLIVLNPVHRLNCEVTGSKISMGDLEFLDNQGICECVSRMVVDNGKSFNWSTRLWMANSNRARAAKWIIEQRVSLNADETFRAQLSIGIGISWCLPERYTSQVWMMWVATALATFLSFIWAVFPMVALGETAVTYFVFIDNHPLVLCICIFQHCTVKCGVIVGSSILGAPCTPEFVGLWRIFPGF